MTVDGHEEHDADGARDGHRPVDYAALTGAVRQLIQVMREGGIGELKVQQGDLSISLSTRAAAAPAPEPVVHAAMLPAVPPAPAIEPTPDTTRVITSPMIGTFYAAPGPGEPPFVQVGDPIEVGQTVAIIEAMKIMNEIVAEFAGIVEEILVKNGDPVEYGHPLMRVRPVA